MGRLERIWLKRAHRGPMDPVDRAHAGAGLGLMGNTNRSRQRQVTIISAERFAQFAEALGAPLDPSARRANLMVSGVELAESRGRTLRVGSVRLRVGGETRPCERMDEAALGLRKLMEPAWGGGVFAEVLDDGDIAVGDVVEWLAVDAGTS
jgi:MOSC domain-containing protein YiiM